MIALENPSVRSYRDLRVWQKAMELAPAVYAALKCLPKEENYALADQIRRAVVSIPANIAEGHAREHRKEFIQFLAIAKGSLAELDTLLELGLRLNYFSAKTTTELQEHIRDLRMPLQGLISRLKNEGC